MTNIQLANKLEEQIMTVLNTAVEGLYIPIFSLLLTLKTYADLTYLWMLAISN